MNKLFNKIAVAFVGIAMAVGVGVAIGSNQNSAVRVDASGEATSTFNTNNSTVTSTGTNKTIIVDGITLTFSNIGDTGNNFISNAKSGTITSTAMPNNKVITSVKLYNCATTSAKTDGGFTVYGGTASNNITTEVGSVTGLSSTTQDKLISFSGYAFNYFQVVNGSARVLKHSKIEVSYADPVAVSSVGLNKNSTTIDVGGSEQLIATVLPDNAANKNITWSIVGDSDISVSNSGLVSVANTATVGDTATVTVTSQADNTKYASCSVTVTAFVPVTSVSLNKSSTSIMVDNTETLVASIDPDNATNQTITWLTSDSSKATVDSNGVVTAKASTGEGTVTITALSDTDGDGEIDENEKKATCAVTVTAYEGKTFTKVTSNLNDWRGTYLIVYEKDTDADTVADKAYILNGGAASINSTGNYVNESIVVDETSSTITSSSKTIDDAALQIYRDSNANYRIKNLSGKYLNGTSGSSTTSLTWADSESNTNKVDSNGIAKDLIKLGGCYIRCNTNWNSDYGFRDYGNSTSCEAAVLYKMDDDGYISEADSYATTFKTATSSICSNYATNTADSFASVWEVANTGLKAQFDALSPDAQGILANTTYVHDSVGNSNTQDAIDRYDWIISRYTSLTDFMNRKGLTVYPYNANSGLYMVNKTAESSTVSIIVIISLVGLTAVGGYFLIRRRKEK